MTDFFLLPGINPNQTNAQKRKFSVSFGDANASLGPINWISTLCRELELYSVDPKTATHLFSGEIYCQENSMPLAFDSDRIHFDSRGLIQVPGVNYHATIEIQHPNLPYIYTEEIFLSARLDDDPVSFAYRYDEPDVLLGIHPNHNWVKVSRELRVIVLDTLRPHGTWPGSFGSMALDYDIDFSEYSKDSPHPMKKDLLVLKADINGVQREFPYSRHYSEPNIRLPTMYDIYDLDWDDVMWDAVVTQIFDLKKNQVIGLKTRMREYQKVIQGVFELAGNCGECIHCKIHDKLRGSDRSTTLYEWLLGTPDKIPKVLRPMIATVLMIPSSVWKSSPGAMAYYCWDMGKREFFDLKQMSGEMSMARGGIYLGRNGTKITPVRGDLPIRKTCFGYTSGTPIRMEFWVGDQKQKRMTVNWIGGLE